MAGWRSSEAGEITMSFENPRGFDLEVIMEGLQLEYPNDADGDALRRLEADRNDMTRPMAIDFTVAVPSRSAGQAVADAAQEMGYRTSVEQNEEDHAWTCYCTKHMVATYEAVVLAQRELDRLSGPHG